MVCSCAQNIPAKQRALHVKRDELALQKSVMLYSPTRLAIHQKKSAKPHGLLRGLAFLQKIWMGIIGTAHRTSLVSNLPNFPLPFYRSC
jgi:hypothetical protein